MFGACLEFLRNEFFDFQIPAIASGVNRSGSNLCGSGKISSSKWNPIIGTCIGLCDLGFARVVSPAERSLLHMACRQLAYKAAKLAAPDSGAAAPEKAGGAQRSRSVCDVAIQE